MEGIKVFFFDETVIQPVLEESLQRVIYPVYIGDEDRRAALWGGVDAVVAEGVGKFFQGAYAAGEDNEGIAGFDHFLLSCYHVRHFDELSNAPVGLLFFNEYLGDNAGDPAAGGHGGVGGKAHEPHGAAAVNHVEAALSQGFPQPSGKGGKGGVISEMGAAVDYNVCVFLHKFSFSLQWVYEMLLMAIVS